MASKQQQYRRWARRLWALAALLVALSVGPAIYCMGWIPGLAAGGDEATYGQCLANHPLVYPTALFLGGLGLAVAGFVMRAMVSVVAEQEEARSRQLDRAVKKAQIDDSVRRSSIDRRALKGGGEPVPEAIEVDEEVQFRGADDEEKGREEESVMSFMEARKEKSEESPRGTKDGAPQPRDWFVPRGLEEAPALYVEAETEPVAVADSSRRIDNPNLPYAELSKALRRAFQIVMDQGTQVVVRLKPGIYQTAVEIPDRVILINHRMPVEATVDQRLAWLRDQVDVDHPERVTILAPRDSDHAVRAVPGRQQGIFGCYLVGRQGVAQTGLRLKDSKATSIVNCAFESFSRSGAEVSGCGEAMSGRRVRFVGCVWRRNTAVDCGGALAIENSHVRVSASIFDSNRAPRGGAIGATKMEKPLVIERSLMQRNRAICDDVPPALDVLELARWRGIDGVGGALLVEQGLAKVEDTIFEGNDAATGGGAVAALGARVVLRSTEPKRGGCQENRAAAGGALLALGWSDRPAMIRVQGVALTMNLATALGGAAAVAGNAVVDLGEVDVETNRAAGGNRGIGGGLAAWKAGTIKIDGGSLNGNGATAGGGAVAVVNGFLKIDGQTRVHDNRAGASGGAIMAMTAPDQELARLIGQPGFSLPFKLKLGQVRINGNASKGPGGGLWAGNALAEATFSLAIGVARPEWIVQNSAAADVRLSQQLCIRWAGQTEANDDRRKTIKLALK